MKDKIDVAKDLAEAFREVRLMREGILPERTWEEFLQELEEEEKYENLSRKAV